MGLTAEHITSASNRLGLESREAAADDSPGWSRRRNPGLKTFSARQSPVGAREMAGFRRPCRARPWMTWFPRVPPAAPPWAIVRRRFAAGTRFNAHMPVSSSAAAVLSPSAESFHIHVVHPSMVRWPVDLRGALGAPWPPQTSCAIGTRSARIRTWSAQQGRGRSTLRYKESQNANGANFAIQSADKPNCSITWRAR